MTVLSGITIRERIEATQLKKEWKEEGFRDYYTPKFGMEINPFVAFSKQACGMSYGLSVAGYDIRVGKIKGSEEGQQEFYESWRLEPGGFLLMSSLERVKIPCDLICFVHDKSTLARQGLALQNTVLEPGWEGWITLELSNHGRKPVRILAGQPIAQLIFHTVDKPTEGYSGKYQNQENEPVEAKFVDGPDNPAKSDSIPTTQEQPDHGDHNG